MGSRTAGSHVQTCSTPVSVRTLRWYSCVRCEAALVDRPALARRNRCEAAQHEFHRNVQVVAEHTGAQRPPEWSWHRVNGARQPNSGVNARFLTAQPALETPVPFGQRDGRLFVASLPIASAPETAPILGSSSAATGWQQALGTKRCAVSLKTRISPDAARTAALRAHAFPPGASPRTIRAAFPDVRELDRRGVRPTGVTRDDHVEQAGGIVRAQARHGPAHGSRRRVVAEAMMTETRRLADMPPVCGSRPKTRATHPYGCGVAEPYEDHSCEANAAIFVSCDGTCHACL